MSADEQGTAVEPTAAERLTAARVGLQRLEVDRAAAQARQMQAQADFDALDAQLMELYRQIDIEGAELAQDTAALEAQRAALAATISSEGLAVKDLARRIASVRSALPAMERAVVEDDLAQAVAIGAEKAQSYRAALQAMLAAAVDFQTVLLRCAGLSDNISRGGWQPAHNLPAHVIEGQDIDHVLLVARSGDSVDVQRAIGQLFERWRI